MNRLLYLMMLVRSWQYWAIIKVVNQDTRGFIIVILVLNLIALVWVAKTISASFKRKELCNRGPYYFIAHPAYSVYLVVDVIFTLLAPSPFMVAGAVLYEAIVVFTAYREEQLLLRMFKEKAVNYLWSRASLHRLFS